MSEERQIWDPMSVEDTASLLWGVSTPWWIAGGWAIDLFLGRQTRPHGDTDVLVRRDSQLEVQAYLVDKGLRLYKTQQPGLKPWLPGEFQDRPFDDVWCRWTPDSPWVLQLMLLDTDGADWVFKCDPSIRGPLDTLGFLTSSGVPYLRPHIQLLYKAKPEVLGKDQADFDLAVPLLPREHQEWLLCHLEKRFDEGHPWIAQLRERIAQRSPEGGGLGAPPEEQR